MTEYKITLKADIFCSHSSKRGAIVKAHRLLLDKLLDTKYFMESELIEVV